MVLSEHVSHMVLDQNEHRKSWKEHDTAEQIDHFLREEFKELQEAKELCMIGDDPFSVVGEIGDMGYLWERRKQFPTPVPTDVVEMLIETERLCAQTGLTMEECVEFKVWRNEIKYPQMVSNNGFGYQRSQQISKDFYRYMGGDQMFSFAYMMMAESIRD